MKHPQKFNILVLSDQRKITGSLAKMLSKYGNYEVTFMPTIFSVFDALKQEPDVLVTDPKGGEVIDCYAWNAA